MDYGYDWQPRPPRPPRRRRRLGFSTRTNVIVVLAAFVICVVLVKASDQPMRLDPRPAPVSAPTTGSPHHH